MRKIDPSKEPIPSAINYSEITSELNRIIFNPTSSANGNIYRGRIELADGTTENTTITALKRKYNNKCGYCESKEFRPCVEHHRPIGQCTGETNGYYWLAYEWSNMVASCDRCNERPNKGTRFPILNSRHSSPSLLADGSPDFNSFRYNGSHLISEGSLILHPEYVDDPSNHFTYDQNGRVISVSNQGLNSIEIFGLNDENLIYYRSQIYTEFINRIEKVITRRFRLEEPISDSLFLEEIGEIMSDIVVRHENQDDNTYTLFTQVMLTNFEYFFISPFDPVIHEELEAVYKTVLDELLNR